MRRVQSAIKIAGLFITALAFYYLIKTCFQLNFHSIHWPTHRLYYVLLAGAVVIYGIFFVLLAGGWYLLLRFLSNKEIPFRDVAGIYVRSNILKYLPGNFMEFVGRNYLVHRYGITHADIALSSVIETVFLAFSSIFVSALCAFPLLKLVLARITFQYHSLFFMAGAGLFILLALVGLNSINRDIRQRLFSLKAMFLAVILILINGAVFLWLGLLMVGILTIVFGVQFSCSQVILIIGALALSWTCGFVTPGSPGGLGVREAVLLMVLSSTIAQGPLVLAAGLHRLVSILGDVFIFGVGSLIPLKEITAK